MRSVPHDHATLLRRSWIVLEALLTAAAFVLAHTARDLLPFRVNPELYPLRDYLPLLLVIVPLWAVLLHGRGLYHTQRLSRVGRQWGQLAAVHFQGGVGVLALVFGVGADWVSRSFLAIFLGGSLLFLAVERLLVMRALRAWRRRGGNVHRVIVVGTDPQAREVADALASTAEWALRIVGYVRLSTPVHTGADDEPQPILGTVPDFAEILDRTPTDEVIFCLTARELTEVQNAIAEAELRGLTTRLVADFVDTTLAGGTYESLNNRPLLTLAPLSGLRFGLLTKQTLDVVLAACLLLLLMPLLTVLGLAVRCSSPGPSIFCQQRVGRYGRRFILYKFRTMRAGSEQLTPELRARNEMTGPVFKLRDDPRVTSVGRVLRRWSLDELPQLWNVLRGDMSLVGPRPPLPDEVAHYQPWQLRRLSMKPGITGLWQVSGRNNVDFEDGVRLDLSYVENWSIAQDLRILVRTIPAILSGRGAA